MDITVVGNSVGGDTAVFKFSAALQGGASPAFLFAGDDLPYYIRKSAGASTWDCSLTAPALGGLLKVNVTGQTSTQIEWTVISTGVEST
jgi:ABC-type glycerol-3-phosphate transport system substrate-binding protein